jgi:alpha-amylase
MPAVVFYFQVHQPFRLRPYTFFDIGENHFYEDDAKNREILQKVAAKCYLPMNALLAELIDRHAGAFKIAFSISGVALDQFERYAPEVLASFQALARTGGVEFLSETEYHSLAFLFSEQEFREQVEIHNRRVETLFGQTPTVFRNTELIYNNALARVMEAMGFRAILAEGADRILGWRSPNFLYLPKTGTRLRLLLKNYRLSDDIAFRFSNRAWNEYPLTADKYASWIHAINGNGEIINLFMDYETFGEHQWAETGIFEFMRALPAAILRHPDFRFMTPSEAAAHHSPVARLDVPDFVSWADIERDLTAWLGNEMQKDAIESLYRLEPEVRRAQRPDLLRVWRQLQTSDHFYYMCTKWFADGDVHKYFNPYGSPYDAYINFMNVLADFEWTLRQAREPAPPAVAPAPAPAEATPPSPPPPTAPSVSPSPSSARRRHKRTPSPSKKSRTAVTRGPSPATPKTSVVSVAKGKHRKPSTASRRAKPATDAARPKSSKNNSSKKR